jgi:ATP-dependent DNA helicase DinG
MLTEHEKTLMRDSLHALRAGLPGFSTRRPQLTMMAAVAHTLAAVGGEGELADSSRRISVIEAGTGTGKTIGYLLPALVLAHVRGRKLVVSSSTVALQEQLLTKDLPALQCHLPFAFRTALVKGRRRYVCPAKLTGLTTQRPVVPEEGEPHRQDARPVRLEGRLAQAFARGSWSGDRDEWPGAIPDGLWHRLSTDRDGCVGARCAEYGR